MDNTKKTIHKVMSANKWLMKFISYITLASQVKEKALKRNKYKTGVQKVILGYV